MSGGRCVFGLGGGWNVEEMENHGADYSRRWKIVREKVLAMREIWREDQAEYHGDFVDFDPIWSWPKPIQTGGPPIWIGANSKWVFDRVADYADGWMPIGGRGSSGVSLGEKIALLKRQAEEGGRDPESLNITSFGIRPDPELIARLQEAGVDRVIFTLPSQEKEEVTPLIDECAKLIK